MKNRRPRAPEVAEGEAATLSPVKDGWNVIAAVLLGALAYWVWLGTAHRSITTDPAISILVAQSILENGYPLLPSGYVYYRGALAHYLLAGGIALFGLNDFSIMFPGILMALGSLVLTYLLARDVLGHPWLGVAAAVLLISVQEHSYYATSPRMYIYLQFFTLLAVYGGWKGHLNDSRRFRWITILAVAGAMLSHQQGGALAVAIPVAVLAIRYWRNGWRACARELSRLTGLAVLLILFLSLITVFSLPRSMPRVALRGGGAPRPLLNLDPLRWMSQINWLEHTVPLGLMLLPAIIVLAYRSVGQRNQATGQGALYLIAVLTLWALGVFGFIDVSGERFWIGIAPVYILVLLTSIQVVMGRPFSPAWDWAARGLPQRKNVRVALLLWSSVVILGISLYYGPSGYLAILKQGYGVPCSVGGENARCSPDLEATFDHLSEFIGPHDLVIATDPMVASYYLRRIDGWFVQRRDGESHSVFESPTDEYFGIPLIDTDEELLALKDSSPRVWIVMYTGRQRDLSDETVSLLERNYHQFHRSSLLTVYVDSVLGLSEHPTKAGAASISHTLGIADIWFAADDESSGM